MGRGEGGEGKAEGQGQGQELVSEEMLVGLRWGGRVDGMEGCSDLRVQNGESKEA